MSIEDLKQEITTRLGIPASLLTSETAEETIAYAKAYLAYMRDCEAKRPKSTEEEFAEWFNHMRGIEKQDEAGTILAEIEERARVDAGGYPRINDAGEVENMPDPRPTSVQFGEWIQQLPAWGKNPFYNSDGWDGFLWL